MVCQPLPRPAAALPFAESEPATAALNTALQLTFVYRGRRAELEDLAAELLTECALSGVGTPRITLQSLGSRRHSLQVRLGESAEGRLENLLALAAQFGCRVR
ncbi:hypothetical protein [Gloeobacter violaceus]|uniref:Gll1885 protein n=1 Tax=Gloeobacter violaceus (strain ATCC 29082 / PCC 7421) TaxID=251221 RepID=Q7NJE7_GLOVI|nr:hypothetical protein [Gloeobacter violaceus]BAC89826.1 gll1885 [Gloeobacter violaceus PCC 7421]